MNISTYLLDDDFDAEWVRNLSRALRNEFVQIAEPKEPDEKRLRDYEKNVARACCSLSDVIASAVYARGYSEDELRAGFRRMCAVRNRLLFQEEIKAVFDYLWTKEPANA